MRHVVRSSSGMLGSSSVTIIIVHHHRHQKEWAEQYVHNNSSMSSCSSSKVVHTPLLTFSSSSSTMNEVSRLVASSTGMISTYTSTFTTTTTSRSFRHPHFGFSRFVCYVAFFRRNAMMGSHVTAIATTTTTTTCKQQEHGRFTIVVVVDSTNIVPSYLLRYGTMEIDLWTHPNVTWLETKKKRTKTKYWSFTPVNNVYKQAATIPNTTRTPGHHPTPTPPARLPYLYTHTSKRKDERWYDRTFFLVYCRRQTMITETVRHCTTPSVSSNPIPPQS